MAVQRLRVFQGGVVPLDDGIVLPLIRELYESRAREEGPKPTADGTRLRASDAMSCSRQMGFKALDMKADLIIDGETLLNFEIGDQFHHAIQKVMEHDLGAVTEIPLSFKPDVDVSGSCDGAYDSVHCPTYTVGSDDIKRAYCDACSAEAENYVNWPCVPSETPDTLAEIKTISGYGFKIAVGQRRSDEGVGPKDEHVCQAAIYAVAPQWKGSIKRLHIIYVNKENHTIAEWLLDMDEQLPRYNGFSPRQMAEIELARMKGITGRLDSGMLPARHIPNFGRVLEPPAANSKDQPWQCRYCRWQPSCSLLPDGPIALSEFGLEIGDSPNV